MKNKVIFIFIFAAISAAGIAAMIFLMQKRTESISTIKSNTESLTESQPKDEPQKIIAQTQSTLLDTAYFSLVLPDGWEQTSATDTLPIAIVNSKEQITNEKAREINFRTNLSVNSTELGEILFKDYVEDTKTRLIQAIPIIEITKKEQYSMNGKDAYYMEIKSVQNDLKFSTVVVLAVGKDSTVWAFSLNTIEELWPDYENIFFDIIKSIKIK